MTQNQICMRAATVPHDKKLSGDSALEADPVMSPANIAPTVAFLASEDSSWLSGRTLRARATR